MEIRVFGSGSSGNCYRLENDSETMLIECGLPFRKIREQLQFRVSALRFGLISHAHADHSKGAKDLAKAGIDLYCLPETAETLGLDGHRIHRLTPLVEVQIGAWCVLPFPVVHDVPTVGFIVRHRTATLLYATDTAYIPYRVPGLTHILVEANYALPLLNAQVRAGHTPPMLRNRIVQTHMSVETVLGFLKANDLSRLEATWLLHLSDAHSDAAAFKTAVSRVTGKPTYIA